jgi:hypothetical protein
MKFADLLMAAIQRSEIPLRFEPGAEEALAQPIIDVLETWLEAHAPEAPKSDFEYGQKALLTQLLEELRGAKDLPSA